MSDLTLDIRHAARGLLRNPGFAAAAILTLGLGIGANTTIFSLVNALLFRSLPVERPDQLVSLFTTDKKNPGFAPLSHLNWRDYRERNDVFSGVLGYDFTAMSVATGSGEPKLVVGQLVSENYFEVLGIRAERGRSFLPEEGKAPTPVAVLSHGFWQEQLGGDPSVVGRTLAINSQAFTVVGVAPASFTGTDVGVRPELWLPMSMNRAIKTDASTNWYEQRRGLFVNAIARLRPGTSIEQAQAALGAIAQNLEREFPDDNKGRAVTLIPLSQATVNPGARGGVIAASALLMTIVGFVLLVACANVSNLLLARAVARRREIAVRLAIGASRGRLVRQMLTESVVLAAPGALLGLLIAFWAKNALLGFLPSLPFPITLSLDLGLDPRVLGFTALVTLLTGIVFGLVPALQASQPGVVEDLKDQSGVRSNPPGRLGVRGLLVAGQVSLCFVALAGAFLFVRSLGSAQRLDPGFESKGLLSMSFNLGVHGYDQPRAEAFFRQLLERVRSLPGVSDAALAQGGPLQPTLLRSVFLEGADPNDRKFVTVNVVGDRYFDAMGIPLVKGRALFESDRQGAPKAVVVNETMARQFWPKADALGQRFRFFGDPQPSEVVGIAKDSTYNNLGEDPLPYAYESLGQRFSPGVALVVRTAGEPGPLVEPARRELMALDGGLAIVGVSTVSQTLHNSLWAPRMGASLLGIFGGLALVLAAIGIYGVTSYTVVQRQREIGIRIALGAQRRDVVRMVLRQAMGSVGLGLGVGLLLAVAGSRLVANMLFGASGSDPATFLVTPLVLGGVAALANLLPALRASTVDPTVALRQ